MKDCDHYQADLSAWLDGELQDSRDLEAHLANCASCRARAAQYHRLDCTLADVTPPPELHRHIMAGFHRTHSPKAKRRFAFGSATAVAAAALLLLLGTSLVALPRWSASHSATSSAENASALAVYDDADGASDTSAPETPESVWVESTSLTADSAPAAAESPESEPVDMDSSPLLGSYSMADRNSSTGSGSVSVSDPETAAADLEEEKEEATATPSDSSDVRYAFTSSSANLESFGADTRPLDESAWEQFQLTVAAGGQLTWTIRDTTPEDLPSLLRQTVDFLCVGEEDLWVASMDADLVFELFSLLYDQLGGDMVISENDTSSIVLDCR